LSPGRLVLYGIVFSLLLILLRLVWTFPGAYVAGYIRTRLLRQNEPWPGARRVFVVGWTGMRGVIALAAAMSLPQTTADGSPFPYRGLIVFLTFSVILVTLVLQGLTLPQIIRILGLTERSGPNCQEQKARRLVLEAASARLKEMRQDDSPERADLYNDLAQHYKHRLASVSGNSRERDIAVTDNYFRYLDLSRTLLDVERQTALRLRNESRTTHMPECDTETERLY
jgi:monovalent cation/hydrogen antiporter